MCKGEKCCSSGLSYKGFFLTGFSDKCSFLKCLLTLVNNKNCEIHDDNLLEVFRAFFTVHLSILQVLLSIIKFI